MTETSNQKTAQEKRVNHRDCWKEGESMSRYNKTGMHCIGIF